MRDRLFLVAIWLPFFLVPFFLVPYNILAWVVGAALYYGAGWHRDDASGDGFLQVVLGAPIGLPLLAYEWARNRLR